VTPQLEKKCASSDANDRVACDAYIAGAIDVLGSIWGQGVGSKADSFARRCLTEKNFDLSQARTAVMKAIAIVKDDPKTLEFSAVHVVMAGVSTKLCSPEN
jgi:hypothetical protein